MYMIISMVSYDGWMDRIEEYNNNDSMVALLLLCYSSFVTRVSVSSSDLSY